MRHYELMVILDPDLEERTINPSLDTFLNVVRKDGGSVEKVDVWGRRRLAQEIDKRVEGIYAVIDLSAEPATMKELDRQLNLNESILRTKVMRPDLRASKPAPGKAPTPSSAVGAPSAGPRPPAPASASASASAEPEASVAPASDEAPAAAGTEPVAAPEAEPAAAPEAEPAAAPEADAGS